MFRFVAVALLAVGLLSIAESSEVYAGGRARVGVRVNAGGRGRLLPRLFRRRVDVGVSVGCGRSTTASSDCATCPSSTTASAPVCANGVCETPASTRVSVNVATGSDQALAEAKVRAMARLGRPSHNVYRKPGGTYFEGVGMNGSTCYPWQYGSRCRRLTGEAHYNGFSIRIWRR